MDISKNVAANLRQYKLDHALTTVELAKELHLAVSTTHDYLHGKANPRSDTLKTVARQMGISVAQLISPPAPAQKRERGLKEAGTALLAAKEFAVLPPDKRAKGIRLFLEMVELWNDVGIN